MPSPDITAREIEAVKQVLQTSYLSIGPCLVEFEKCFAAYIGARHISPGATLAGNVRVGPLAHIGLGASIIEGVSVGTGSIIGAGAALVEDIPPWVVAVGVPAKIMRARQN